MSDPGPGRILAGWGIVLLSVLLFFMLVFQMTAGPSLPFPSGSGTSPDWGVGDGLVTVEMSQNVSGTPYWQEDCVPPQSASFCSDPEGVAYIPSLNLVALTEQTGGITGGTNAFTMFDPSTLAAAPLHLLGCAPEVPFYPGTGSDFYIPCLAPSSYNNGPLLVIDGQSGSIVKNVSLPFRTNSMAFDSNNGMIYVAGSGNALATLDPVNDSVIDLRNVTGADFSDYFLSVGYELVFDSVTDQLIAPASNGSLLEIDPDSGVAAGSIPLGSPTIALAMDSGSNQLLASTSNTPSVYVFNSRTYQIVNSFTFPNCVAYVCDSGNVNQMLIDPTHGDAYLVTSGWLYALNLSSLAIVGQIQDIGDGPQLSSVTYLWMTESSEPTQTAL